MITRKLWLATIASLIATQAIAATITFDDLNLPANSYFRTGASTTFMSGGATFFHEAPFGDCCWSGFTYSNKTDSTTPGFVNDGSAITADGVGPGQDNYGVAYGDGAHLEFQTPQTVLSAYFTNTTYAFLAMRDGNDGNSPPFVKGPFGSTDFFTLSVTGLDENNSQVGSIDVALAAGTNILNTWTSVDLSSLGMVKSLEFAFASSDTGPFGVNTPTYFAVDDLTTVPVPATGWLLITGFALAARFRRRGGSGTNQLQL